MAQPSVGSAHLKTALGGVSIAYRNESYIGLDIFPAVPVNHQSDEYFIFDKSSWLRNEAGPRAPATRGPEGGYSLSSSAYACRPVSFTHLVPDELVDNADSPLNPLRDGTEFATDKVLLYLEVDVAADVFGNSVWSASATPGTTWDADASDPINDVAVGKETVVKAIGREPNVMVVGREVYTDLRKHPDLLAVVYPNMPITRGLLSAQQLATIFEVDKFLVGTAIYDSAAEGATASVGFVWGKHAWIGYVAPRPSLYTPSAGYVFAWKNREVKLFRRDEEEATAVRSAMNYDCKVTSADSGYLLKSIVA
ncbi:MAG: hypothetical protein ACYS8L_08030 [Planctomycetota bacterium]|jgi:hypothetical protein